MDFHKLTISEQNPCITKTDKARGIGYRPKIHQLVQFTGGIIQCRIYLIPIWLLSFGNPHQLQNIMNMKCKWTGSKLMCLTLYEMPLSSLKNVWVLKSQSNWQELLEEFDVNWQSYRMNLSYQPSGLGYSVLQIIGELGNQDADIYTVVLKTNLWFGLWPSHFLIMYFSVWRLCVILF